MLEAKNAFKLPNTNTLPKTIKSTEKKGTYHEPTASWYKVRGWNG
jgi:hypothetical protein